MTRQRRSAILLLVTASVWTSDVARDYDEDSAHTYARGVLEPTVDFLSTRAGDRPAVEFAIGTGRVALPLAARGVRVAGIEMSEPLAAELRKKPGGDDVQVTIGDMATTTAPGRFGLVYMVYDAVTLLLTQAERVQCFRNAARHLEPGGRWADWSENAFTADSGSHVSVWQKPA